MPSAWMRFPAESKHIEKTKVQRRDPFGTQLLKGWAKKKPFPLFRRRKMSGHKNKRRERTRKWSHGSQKRVSRKIGYSQ